MDRRTRKMKRQNSVKRCCVSGKIINPRDDVVLTSYAVDYVRKCGHLVSTAKFSLLFILTLLVLLSSVEASVCNLSEPSSCGGLGVNLNSRINIVMLFIFFLVSAVLFYFRLFLYSSVILFIVGFVLLFNGFNPILSFVIISSGVGVAFLR